MCVQQLINAGELAPYIGLRPRLTRLLELLAKYAGEKHNSFAVAKKPSPRTCHALLGLFLATFTRFRL